MLHIICALKPEAQPLLEHFELRARPDAARIFHNPATRISLTLSGIGKSAAAAAVTRTHAHFNADKTHAWLNLGIAGHADLPLGQAVMVNKITDAASGQTWFPSRVFNVPLPTASLITLEQPNSHYRKALFDMECAGFFQAASGIATLELVQALKIVSDNTGQPMDAVTPTLASRLVAQNLPVIEAVAGQLLALSALLQRLEEPGPDYQALTRRHHFTVSQQHRLRDLLRKWQTLHPDDTNLTARLQRKKTAAEVLRHLQEELEKIPMKLGLP